MDGHGSENVDIQIAIGLQAVFLKQFVLIKYIKIT